MARNIYKLKGITIIGGTGIIKSKSDNTMLQRMCLGHIGEHGMMEFHKRKLLKGIQTCRL